MPLLVALLLHVPPAVVSLNVIDEPAQTVEAPVIEPVAYTDKAVRKIKRVTTRCFIRAINYSKVTDYA